MIICIYMYVLKSLKLNTVSINIGALANTDTYVFYFL